MNKLGTKAETLKRLYQRLENAEVLPQISFTVQDWENNKECVLKEFKAQSWHASPVAVRSSSLMEDTQSESCAGKYRSVLDVSGCGEFEHAVNQVVASYDGNAGDQVLVQPMLTDVRLCGVAFTSDPNTFGNYYVINYDDTGSTSAVTSGRAASGFLYYQFKGAEDESGPADMARLCRALRELEAFFGRESLDVEFAFAQERIYILQVRALCVKGALADFKMQKTGLERIRRKLRQLQGPKPFLCGKKAVYSVMTDWNPAEMIGVRPKPLALSLYREIITDRVWAYQRDNYGYRNLRSFPLMVDFGGQPYIDVRVSFNSFIPAELDRGISEKLADYYIGRLCEEPLKHDKAEFEIVFSCYTLDLPERIQVLKDYGFSEKEIGKIVDALRNVTNRIIDHENGLWRKDYGKIEKLDARYSEIMESGMDDIEKAYWLLEDCKRYGTLPFAGLARGAFIAVQILQSFVAGGIITDSDYENFMGGVHTVSSGMHADFKELSKEAFLKKYGHLRPGTYDITSLRYDEAPELYFAWEEEECGGPEETKGKTFRLSLTQLNELKKKLHENGLAVDLLDLFDFIKTVIEGREYGKFVFTRNLSRAIQLIGEIGRQAGLKKEDCAFLNINAVYALYASARDVKEELFHAVQRGRKDYEMTQSITLPPVLLDPEDAVRFYYPDSEPNFITAGRVCGEAFLLDSLEEAAGMEGKIVLIQSADPGYDWIFSHGVRGFITMYGGANSHMAIRAGELGIPAVIGVGARQFETYRRAAVIEIDAQGKNVKILR